MTAITPYLSLPGTAREALDYYQSVFGGTIDAFTFEQFGREDGPADAITHGQLVGHVPISASDAVPGEPVLAVSGLSFALLGTADAETLTAWFTALSDGGTVDNELQARPWGDTDGQVTDRFGIRWLIGFHGTTP